MKILNIIVPVYNEEKTIKKTIEKIFALKNENFIKNNNIKIEIIVVDDASIDLS